MSGIPNPATGIRNPISGIRHPGAEHMVLNYIWVGFFLVALVIALIKLIFMGDTAIFTSLVTSTFDMSKTAFDIALGLTGALALWLGIMKVGEQGGAINILASITRPFFRRL